MCHSSDNNRKEGFKAVVQRKSMERGAKSQTSNTWILSFIFCETQENGRKSDLSKEK